MKAVKVMIPADLIADSAKQDKGIEVLVRVHDWGVEGDVRPTGGGVRVWTPVGIFDGTVEEVQ